MRHDDPHLGPYTPRGAVIRSAMELASDVEGLRLYLVTALGDRYEVRVADDGSVIGLWTLVLARYFVSRDHSTEGEPDATRQRRRGATTP